MATKSAKGITAGDYAKLYNTAGQSDMDLKKKLLNSYAPPELLGAGDLGGSSSFSSIAHRTQQNNKLNNLLNNGVDDEIQMVFQDKNGDAITTPFMYGGEMRYPNAKGVVRLANMAPVELAKQVKKYEEDKTDDLMDLLMLGDDVAAYVIGVKAAEWTTMCKKSGKPQGFKDAPDGKGTPYMSKEMSDEDCTIENIESLVAGSISQTRALSKLRRIAKHYLRNVNLEAFDSMLEKKRDMKSGNNTDKAAPPAVVPPGGAGGGTGS